MTSAPPLTGLRVLELAGLAPGPFAGLMLADYGASVLRIDRAKPSTTHTDKRSPPTSDNLVRHKKSICVDFKSPGGIALIHSLLTTTDVVIDPFRPGVLEKLQLGPDVIARINPRCILARMTGYRRDGKYSAMAGHDINYIAVSGVLSLLGGKGEKPLPPGNILGDFAGGGAVLFTGILLALLNREKTGRGQVVEANMVDGASYLGTFPRLAMHVRENSNPQWNKERGMNILDGGAPFYATYETKDGKYMSVGALEPQFFSELMKGLKLEEDDLPGGNRMDPAYWPAQIEHFTKIFKQKTRSEWEKIFDGTDACVSPVLTHPELKASGYDQRPLVTLKDSPGRAIAKYKDGGPKQAAEGQGPGVDGEGWEENGIGPGEGGEQLLDRWLGWQRGKQYHVENGGLVLVQEKPKSKL